MIDALVVLARSPRSGTGKTRLRAALAGCEAMLIDRLVTAMASDTLHWAGRDRVLVVAGRGDLGPLRRLAPAAVHVGQAPGTFGQRIENAVAAGLAAAPDVVRVVLIGTDSPTLPAALIDAAFAGVESADDAVIVPAVDGGWVALGVATRLDGALASSAVRWSTAEAAADTAAALRVAGRRVTLLPPWYDVDELDGLRRLGRDHTAGDRAPRTVAALRDVSAEIALTRAAS